MTQDFMSKFSQEAEQLKTRLQPYAMEMVADLQRQMKDMKKDTMDPEVLKSTLLQKSQELKGQLEKNINELQAQMVPYTEEIKEKIEQSLEEFQMNMATLAKSLETQLKEKTQQIQQSLAPYGEELRSKLDTDAQNLNRQLTGLWRSFMKLIQ